jgi:DNA topoisomerase-1
MPTTTIDMLGDLYSDTKTCAKLVGLRYIGTEDVGLSRRSVGKGFSYIDSDERVIKDHLLKQRIIDLVIPPAWKDVWICPDDTGHVLATGIDEKGRKQYIYHPKWRTLRDLIKFYRMISFGHCLPKIRSTIDAHVSLGDFSKEHVMAVMLWILDNAYIRIGNEIYFHENNSVGLTTLTKSNIVIANSVVTVSFLAKSGKQQQITFDNSRIAAILKDLSTMKGDRLFRFKDESTKQLHDINADDLNSYLHDITGVHISAKDFRTWGGTLVAFMRLQDAHKKSEKITKSTVIEAIDQAAAVLGNTRSVARASYVHPDILEAYSSEHFDGYYSAARRRRKKAGLDKQESTLLYMLEDLFEKEFDTLQKQAASS